MDMESPFFLMRNHERSTMRLRSDSFQDGAVLGVATLRQKIKSAESLGFFVKLQCVCVDLRETVSRSAKFSNFSKPLDFVIPPYMRLRRKNVAALNTFLVWQRCRLAKACRALYIQCEALRISAAFSTRFWIV